MGFMGFFGFGASGQPEFPLSGKTPTIDAGHVTFSILLIRRCGPVS